MRIFVTGPGRCGSATFYHACRHIENYSCDHESKSGRLTIGNWEFPDNHIEVASNLLLGLPILKKEYPDALWFFLDRNWMNCIQSLTTEAKRSMEIFARQWWYIPDSADFKIEISATAYYRFCVNQFQAFEPKKSRFLTIDTIKPDFKRFWKETKAKGNLTAALAEFDRHYNSHKKRGRDKWV